MTGQSYSNVTKNLYDYVAKWANVRFQIVRRRKQGADDRRCSRQIGGNYGSKSCRPFSSLRVCRLGSPMRRTRKADIPELESSTVGWAKAADDFEPPQSGPGPVTSDKDHPYVPNGFGRQVTFRIADLTNPILKPWVIEKNA